MGIILDQPSLAFLARWPFAIARTAATASSDFLVKQLSASDVDRSSSDIAGTVGK